MFVFVAYYLVADLGQGRRVQHSATAAIPETMLLLLSMPFELRYQLYHCCQHHDPTANSPRSNPRPALLYLNASSIMSRVSVNGGLQQLITSKLERARSVREYDERVLAT